MFLIPPSPSTPKKLSLCLRAMVLGAALLSIVGTASGALIFNNLSSTNAQTGYSFGVHTSYAQKFSSGSGGIITNISLNLFNSGVGTNSFTGGFTVSLFPDTGGSGPASFGFFDYFSGDEGDLGTPGGAPISLTGNIVGANTPLAAGTYYWLVVQKDASTNGSSLNWGGGANAQGGAGQNYMTTNYGGTWTEITSFSDGFGAEILTQPVPEPGTWTAAALLVGTAGYVSWRKCAKVS